MELPTADPGGEVICRTCTRRFPVTRVLDASVPAPGTGTTTGDERSTRARLSPARAGIFLLIVAILGIAVWITVDHLAKAAG